MRNAAKSVALLVLLLPTAGAAPVPRDDTPAALIGRWEFAGECLDGDLSKPVNLLHVKRTLEFRPNNTLENRVTILASSVSHGTYGVRRGVVSYNLATWGDGSASRMTILELTGDKLLVETGNGGIDWFTRLPHRAGTPARK
jgi:hypothetical protein